ncbi:hypothetical protein HMPREF0322_05178 [Desulfitobacterium hafniense DP7]|uniref:Uncharacterized protein n=1 Tax=Desulfitobacterium hafniense DP7 TaxID=537010 RepID=G9XVZ5_DESHA|nr:hypothetical protein HMPREF0322_05178 [Desulfitobacterium hafniense DP7]
MGGWKRPVSNLTPLQSFREDCLPARLKSAHFCKSKILGLLFESEWVHIWGKLPNDPCKLFSSICRCCQYNGYPILKPQKSLVKIPKKALIRDP